MGDESRRRMELEDGESGNNASHVTSEEFTPLHPRYDADAFKPGLGRCAQARRLLRRHWLELAAGFLALCCLGYLAAINSGVRAIGGAAPASATAGAAVNLAALAPTLVEHATDFVTLYTSSSSSELLFLDFPAATVTGEGPQPQVLFSAVYATGTFNNDSSSALLHYPAEDTDNTVFSFRLTEDMRGVDVLRDQMLLRTTDDGMREALEEGAPSEWVTTLSVLAVRKKEDSGTDQPWVLVLARDLLVNGFYVSGLSETLLSRARLKLSETRAFPNNVDLTVEYLLKSKTTTTASTATTEKLAGIPVSMRFSLSKLPEEPMVPRVADERVGYFTTTFYDLGDHRGQDTSRRPLDLLDPQVAVINKRRMARGPDGKVLKPLTYYVDPSVPEAWREAIRKGVENWRPAFQALGYGPKAIRAVLPGEEGWPSDYDAADIRYNSITWAVDLERVFALGPATLDPRTGEILRSNIVFTNGWIRSWENSFEETGRTGGRRRHRALLEEDPGHKVGDWEREDHLPLHHAAHEHRHQHGHGEAERHQGFHMHWEAPVLGEAAEGGGGRRPGAGSLRQHVHGSCQEARALDSSAPLLHVMSNAPTAAKAEDGGGGGGEADVLAGVPTEVLEAGLTDTCMHEVGHTLGLRHNFKGSTSLSLAEAQDPDVVAEKGLTSSVMDYLPLNLVSSKLRGDKKPLFFTPVIGEYDRWAIEYGYTKAEGEGLLRQHPDLAAVAAKALPFSTDEDGPSSSGMDPTVSTFDLGSEPLDFYEDKLDLVAELRPSLLDRSVLLGAPFTDFQQGETALLTQVLVAGLYAAKYVAGFETSKQRRVAEDTPAPLRAVSAERQRRALALVVRVLSGDAPDGGADFLPAPAEVPEAVGRGGECTGMERYCLAVTPYDLLSKVSLVRKRVLLNLVSLDRLKRLRIHRWADPEGLAGPELFRELTTAIWGEGGFQGDRVKHWENWDIMLFWFDVLQAYAAAPATVGVPGDLTATAAGLVYALVEGGEGLPAGDEAQGLYRAAYRRMKEWESLGTAASGTAKMLLLLKGTGTPTT